MYAKEVFNNQNKIINKIDNEKFGIVNLTMISAVFVRIF